MFDYDVLRVLWWAILGVLLIGIAVMDGFDLGTAILLPFIGKTDVERRTIINTVGPVWEGNQVWLITGGGAIFAAWPPLYATAFSGFYLAMLLLLLALILRPVGFKFRSKIENRAWRMFGTGPCSSAASCRRSSSASRSGTCCRASRSDSIRIFASPTRARSSGCSTRSPCCAASSVSR